MNRLHELGMCISYDQVRDISKVMTNSVIKKFEAEGVTCGQILRKRLLTVGSTDNFDMNPFNRDAKDALHGTGCALAQLPMYDIIDSSISKVLVGTGGGMLSSTAKLPDICITLLTYPSFT